MTGASGAGVVLSAAGLTHVPLLAALHGRAFEEAWDEEAFATLLATPGTAALFARAHEEGPPIGLVLWRQAADEAEILSLAVLPEARGAGVARALMRAVMAALAKTPCQALFLEVGADNEAACRLYTRLGFRRVGTRPGYYRRKGRAAVDAWVLRRDPPYAADEILDGHEVVGARLIDYRS